MERELRILHVIPEEFESCTEDPSLLSCCEIFSNLQDTPNSSLFCITVPVLESKFSAEETQFNWKEKKNLGDLWKGQQKRHHGGNDSEKAGRLLP